MLQTSKRPPQAVQKYWMESDIPVGWFLHRFGPGPAFLIPLNHTTFLDSRVLDASDRISDPHAVLTILEDGECLLQDLRSKNGTFVNCHPVSHIGTNLEESDLICFGYKEPRGPQDYGFILRYKDPPNCTIDQTSVPAREETCDSSSNDERNTKDYLYSFDESVSSSSFNDEWIVNDDGCLIEVEKTVIENNITSKHVIETIKTGPKDVQLQLVDGSYDELVSIAQVNAEVFAENSVNGSDTEKNEPSKMSDPIVPIKPSDIENNTNNKGIVTSEILFEVLRSKKKCSDDYASSGLNDSRRSNLTPKSSCKHNLTTDQETSSDASEEYDCNNNITFQKEDDCDRNKPRRICGGECRTAFQGIPNSKPTQSMSSNMDINLSRRKSLQKKTGWKIFPKENCKPRRKYDPTVMDTNTMMTSNISFEDSQTSDNSSSSKDYRESSHNPKNVFKRISTAKNRSREKNSLNGKRKINEHSENNYSPVLLLKRRWCVSESSSTETTCTNNIVGQKENHCNRNKPIRNGGGELRTAFQGVLNSQPITSEMPSNMEANLFQTRSGEKRPKKSSCVKKVRNNKKELRNIVENPKKAVNKKPNNHKSMKIGNNEKSCWNGFKIPKKTAHKEQEKDIKQIHSLPFSITLPNRAEVFRRDTKLKTFIPSPAKSSSSGSPTHSSDLQSNPSKTVQRTNSNNSPEKQFSDCLSNLSSPPKRFKDSSKSKIMKLYKYRIPIPGGGSDVRK